MFVVVGACQTARQEATAKGAGQGCVCAAWLVWLSLVCLFPAMLAACLLAIVFLLWPQIPFAFSICAAAGYAKRNGQKNRDKRSTHFAVKEAASYA